ncbi:MAG: hypothetical protein MUC48_25475 [Leptolyngbya sp. Prado105]|nr:hypothetical protein [Leptolyngbya sp. Prado105]
MIHLQAGWKRSGSKHLRFTISNGFLQLVQDLSYPKSDYCSSVLDRVQSECSSLVSDAAISIPVAAFLSPGRGVVRSDNSGHLPQVLLDMQSYY